MAHLWWYREVVVAVEVEVEAVVVEVEAVVVVEAVAEMMEMA